MTLLELFEMFLKISKYFMLFMSHYAIQEPNKTVTNYKLYIKIDEGFLLVQRFQTVCMSRGVDIHNLLRTNKT